MLNLQIPINRLGYGVAGSNIAFEMSKLTDVAIWPIGQPEFTSPRIKDDLVKCLNNAGQAQFSQPTIKIWHQHDLISRVGNGQYYGWPIFELNKFNDFELLNLRCPHELIVCSKWAQEVLKTYNLKSHVIPLGIDPWIFSSHLSTEIIPGYKFFNIGKIEIRKGHDILIECFNNAFTEKDDVSLHLMWFNPFLSYDETQAWHKLAKTSKLKDKIHIHPPVPEHYQVVDFINNMDCGVFPSHAEGWNLELLESMACGKPVIATNYSAHTEFCTPQNSYLINIDKLDVAEDGKWFHGNGEWAFIGHKEKEQIIEHMRYCYNNRPSNDAGKETSKVFTWENSARKLHEILNS